MYTGYYFTELIVKERQRQWVAEADRLRQVKATKSKMTKNSKRKIDLIADHMRTLGTFLFRNHARSICEC